MFKKILVAFLLLPTIAFASGDYILPTVYTIILTFIVVLVWVMILKWKLLGKALLFIIFLAGIMISGGITADLSISFYHYIIPTIFFSLPLHFLSTI
jgi:hypothetical protein